MCINKLKRNHADIYVVVQYIYTEQIQANHISTLYWIKQDTSWFIKSIDKSILLVQSGFFSPLKEKIDVECRVDYTQNEKKAIFVFLFLIKEMILKIENKSLDVYDGNT